MCSLPGEKDLTKDLNLSQTNTFLYILNKVIDNKVCTSSNKEISDALKISISTLEKHLSYLDKLGLIVRDTVRGQNPFTLKWETVSRKITIPEDKIDPRVLSIMHSQRVNDMLEMIITPESHKLMIKQMKESRGSS